MKTISDILIEESMKHINFDIKEPIKHENFSEDYDEIMVLYQAVRNLIDKIFRKLVIDITNNNCLDMLHENPFIPRILKIELVSFTNNYKIDLNTDLGQIRLVYITGRPLNIKDIETIKQILTRTLLLKILSNNRLDNTIYIWTGTYKKLLPLNENKNLILGPEQINSGSTIINGFTNGTIYIWRSEELLKVLIHELIHSMHLDLSKENSIKGDNIIKIFFCIKKECNVNEAYTEFIANIFNCMFCAFENKYCLYKFYKMLHIELRFSIFQVAKILVYQGYRKFEDMYRDNGCIVFFDENTSIFSYFIIKSIFLDNYEEIIENVGIRELLCTKEVQDKAIGKLYNSLKSKYPIKVNKVISNIENEYISRSLRMTCIETKIDTIYFN